MNIRGRGFFHVEYRPDAGSGSEGAGLMSCCVCRGIASAKCVECEAPVCDQVCPGAHRMDHPKFAVVQKRVA